jgi:hypothetical protein
MIPSTYIDGRPRSLSEVRAADTAELPDGTMLYRTKDSHAENPYYLCWSTDPGDAHAYGYSDAQVLALADRVYEAVYTLTDKGRAVLAGTGDLGAPSDEDPAESINGFYDDVISPAHYTEGRRHEPKDVIRDWGLNFNLGAAVKYISRAGRKGDAIEDLMKAQQFIDFELEALREEADAA